MSEHSWNRLKSKEGGEILGWFENGESIITLTKGLAHIVHRGKAFVVKTDAEVFSVKPDTIAEKLQRMLR